MFKYVIEMFVMSITNSTILKPLLCVGAVFALLIFEVCSLPLELNSPEPQKSLSPDADEQEQVGYEQRFIQLRESDKTLLRAIALFIGILVVFSIIICLCAMYWCMCWVLQCPGVSTLRAIARAARSCNSRLRTTRSRVNNRKPNKGNIHDLPPSYETILASKDNAVNVEDVYLEEDPPTYSEALCKEHDEL